MTLRQLVAATVLVAASVIARAESSPPAAPPVPVAPAPAAPAPVPAPATTPVVSNIPNKLGANCREAITPTTAQRLFDVLNKPLPGSACQFQGVLTETNVLAATWTANGHELPAVRVAAAGCLGNAQAPKDTLEAAIPPEVASACPGVKPVIDDFVKSLSHEHAIAVSPPPSSRLANVFFDIAYGLLIVAALVIAFWQYFRKKPTSG